MNNKLSIIPLGGVGDVTRNMYIYELRDQILVVDCGLGFADETMLGVDLLLPDVSYLLNTKKRIVGFLLTHGHEDHIGATPFILPQLFSSGKQFPLFATPFTAELTNEKLKEFDFNYRVRPVLFDNKSLQLGDFKVTFIHVTHSVPDTSHIFIETPIGNIYHGSDYKFDDTPYSGKKSDYETIQYVSQKGVMGMLSDCLGSERKGRTKTEKDIILEFEREIKECRGKVLVTTYSSHVARINQVIDAARKNNRKICFVGRSLLKAKEVAKRLGYLHLDNTIEVPLDQLHLYEDKHMVLIVAGSQGQENSGMSRIANGEHKDVKLKSEDTVIISADPIPGNEILAYGLIDSLARRVRVLYTGINNNLHVSGHGSQEEIAQLISLVKPKKLIPIGGNFRHMVSYRDLAQRLGYKKNDVLLLEDGQELLIDQNSASFGRTIPVKTVYVDEVSGEELESYELRDRQKLAEGGIVIVLAEVESSTGQLAEKPDVIVRGFTQTEDKRLNNSLYKEIKSRLSHKKGKVTNWVYIRKLIGEITEKMLYKRFRRRPLVLPIVIEV